MYAIVAFTLTRRLIRKYSIDHENDLVALIFGAIAGTSALLLALVVVTLWDNFTTVQRNVNREAAEIRLVGRDIYALSGRDAQRYRQEFTTYTRRLARDELPQLCSGTGSETAGLSLDRLQRDFVLSGSTKFDSILTATGDLEALRNARIAAAKPVIIWEVWLSAFVLVALQLLLPPFFGTRHAGVHLVLVLLLATALATIFFIALRLDNVFCGSTSVDLTPLRSLVVSR